MSNEPIEPQDYVCGVKVVDIGDVRVARGMTRRPASSCRHHRMTYDQRERRVWCEDCERDVDAFDALLIVVEHFDAADKRLDRREERLREAEGHKLRSVAAKELDRAWQHRNMVPACPACGEGLFPEDFKNGTAMLGREWAKARRALKVKKERK